MGRKGFSKHLVMQKPLLATTNPFALLPGEEVYFVEGFYSLHLIYPYPFHSGGFGGFSAGIAVFKNKAMLRGYA